MSKPNLTKGGIVTNLDKPEIDPVKRYEAERDETAAAIVDEAIKEARQRGGDTFKVATRDEIDSGKVKLDVTFDEVRKTHREMGQREYARPRALVIDPNAPGGWAWDVDPRVREEVAEGRRCPNCLRAQANPGNPKCEWQVAPHPRIRGCGYSWLADDVFSYDR